MQNENAVCCPKFNPERWDGKTFNWSNKPFIMDSVPTLFHMPFPPMLGKKIARMCRMIEESKTADPNKEDTLVLFRDPSAFKSEIYISVTEPVPNAKNASISGTFIGKVYAGPYNAVPKFAKQLDEYLASKGQKAKDYYVHYAYCPKCAKKYGDNHMIIFARV